MLGRSGAPGSAAPNVGGVMTFRTGADRAKAWMLAAGLCLLLASPAIAQRAAIGEIDASATEGAPDANDDVLKDIDVDKLDFTLLDVDGSTLKDGPAAKARTARQSDGGGLDWSNRNQGNGSSAVSVKQSVSPFWDARVGADMTVTREPATMSELLAEKTANGGNLPQSGGTAWAAVTAPGAGGVWDKTAVEARINPNTDESKLGTSINKQVPLGDQTALTLSGGANVTQQGSMMPLPGFSTRPSRNYETEQSAKVELTDTGTSFTAGQTLSTSDDKWLRKVGAEQKLFGGVTVSGSIGETAQGTTNKSLTAGFKKSW
jgi:hypothetical protein